MKANDDFYTLRDQDLMLTADEMEAGQREFPATHVTNEGVSYPSFPDALRRVAQADPPNKCVSCRKPGYYYPADKPYAPGHCYSEQGRLEFTRISSCCEFCFDYMFREPEEEEPMDDSHARLEDAYNYEQEARAQDGSD